MDKAVSRPSDSVSTQSVQNLEEKSDEIRSYRRRFLVAGLMFFTIGIRGFNQSCFGSANSVLAKFFKVQPWQIDWLTVIQSVIFVVATLPISFVSTRVGFRSATLMMNGFLLLGFVLNLASFWIHSGYILALTGQAVTGLSNVVSLSIQSATAAIWFPANEVSTATAVMTISRGIGEAGGAVALANLLYVTDSTSAIRLKLTYVFGTISGILAVVFVLVMLFVKDKPDLPPSIAQSKAQVCQEREKAMAVSMKDGLLQFNALLKALFTDRHFLIVWVVFGVVNPVLRNYTILLASLLNNQFSKDKDLNSASGFVLMGAWLLFIVGGFAAGPILTKTKRYRAVVVVSISMESASCLLGIIGIKTMSLPLIYVGTIALGLFLGAACVSLFELLMEVTYPLPALQVTMLNIIGLGFMRLTYPIIGRVLLVKSGAAASVAYPFIMTALASLLLLSQKLPFRRLRAEIFETTYLVQSDSE